jgi:hypothetical protein
MSENYEDPQDAARRNENLRDYNKLMGDFIRDLEDRMTLEEKQARQLKSTQERFKDLDAALKTGQRKTIDLTKDFRSLQAAINQLEDGAEKQALQQKLDVDAAKARRAVITKAAIDTAEAGAKALYGGAVNTAKAVSQAYMSNASAFTTAGAVINAGLEASAQAVGGATAAIGTMAVGLGALAGPGGAIAGALVAGISSLFGSIYKQSVDLAKQATSLAVAEMENTIKSYTTASKAGALFADGLTGLRKAAKAAGLDQQQYANVLAQTTPMLAQFGGSVTQGVARFTSISGIMNKQFAPGLLKLGYSIDEIAAGTADYLGFLGRYDLAKGKTDAQLATESDKYLTNLKAISAYTGEQAGQAKKRAETELDQMAVQARLQDIARASGQSLSEVNIKYENLLKTFGPGSEKIASQMLTLGTTTGDLAIVTAQVPAYMELMQKSQELLSNKNIDQSAVITEITKLQQHYAPLIQEQTIATGRSIGIANQANASYGEVNRSIGTINRESNKWGKATATAVEDAKKTKTTQDKLTGEYVEATIEFQKMRLEIQAKLTPAITGFAKVTKDVIIELEKIIAKMPGMAEMMLPEPGAAVVSGDAVVEKYDKDKNAPGRPKDWDKMSSEDKRHIGEAHAGVETQQNGLAQKNLRQKARATANLAKRDNTDKDGFISKLPGLNYPEDKVGKGIQASLYDLLLTPPLFGRQLTSLYRAGDTGAHGQGKGADVSIMGLDGQPMSAKAISDLVMQIKSAGAVKVFAESKPSDQEWLDSISDVPGGLGKSGILANPGATGRHIHLEAKKFGGQMGANDTTIVGESGPEIISGAGVATSTASTSAVFAELNRNMKELVEVSKDNRDYSKKILQATA